MTCSGSIQPASSDSRMSVKARIALFISQELIVQAIALTRPEEGLNTSARLIVSDAVRSQANDLSHPQCFGLEIRKTEETTEKVGNLASTFFGQGNGDDAVFTVRPHFFPKVGDIDRDKGGLSYFE